MEPEEEGCGTGTECHKKSNVRVARVGPVLGIVGDPPLVRSAEKVVAKGDASQRGLALTPLQRAQIVPSVLHMPCIPEQ